MEDVSLRLVGPDESALIFSFLTIAARMDEAEEPIQKALSEPGLSKYWKGWGRAGDLGVVALSAAAGHPVSCAWVRLFPRDEAGYGFVAESVPELGIGTTASYRNRGVGTKTLAALLDRCRGRYPGVSLSVRQDSAAIRLYERFGFERLPGSEGVNRVGTGSITMLLRFSP